MKVIILTECGKNIGFGHISRCSSLYDEALSRKLNVKFFIYGDINSVEFLKSKEIVNVNWMDENYLIDNIKYDDYVIVDSYVADIQKYEIISQKSRKSIYIDDNGRLNYPKGIIINPSLDSSHINYSKLKNSKLLSGSEFVILRQAFIDAKREKISNEIKRVLIVIGGTDIRNIIPKIINGICKTYKDVVFDIVVGNEEQLQMLRKNSGLSNIKIHCNIDDKNMCNIMLNSDLAITAAGQTMYELLATQTPFIPIQIIENQDNNIKSILKYNPEQVVLKYNDKAIIKKLKEYIGLFNDLDYRKKQIRKYESLVDGYGAKRIIDVLINI